MEIETIFADFNNADRNGRIRLNTVGSFRDINENKIDLKEGKQVLLDDGDELRIIGILKFSKEESVWVAEINPDNYIYY